MNFHRAVKTTEKFAIDNSPALLTAVGVVGTVATAVLTGKASIKASRLLEEARVVAIPEELTSKDKIAEVWKLYIPPVAVGTITVVSIVGSNRIGTRRAAGLAAAMTLSETAFTEYREKVSERLGANKERDIRDEIAQDRVSRTPGASEIIVMGSKSLFMDTYSGRYLESTMEEVKKAQNDINYHILNDTYATLSDFYHKIGLSSTKFSDELGWSHAEQLELEFTGAIAEDGRPCIAISFRTAPVRDYYQFH